MPLSTNPSDEIAKFTTCETATSSLRERWDEDYAQFRLDSEDYSIPEEEGEWEQVVTNRAAAEAYKIMDYLAYARRKLWIPIRDEDKKGRKSLTLTEQLVNGCIFTADNLQSGLPYEIESQALLAFYRTIRGWTSMRFILRDEDEKLIPDLAVWDIRNTYWLTGKQRLTWVGYVRYATKDEILDEYPGWNGTVGADGFVAVNDVWQVEGNKEAEEGVIIGSEYVKEPTKIGLNYISIRIKAGRGTPLVSDKKHSDNVKMVGEGWLANNRTLYPAESRLLSYQMTRAGQLAKAPVIIEFNSDLAPQPKGMDKDPFVKDRVIFLDTAKGQRFSDRLIPPSGADILTMLGQIQGMESIGGLSPVAWGQINQALPAQGIDILTHSTMDAIKPFKLGIEQDYKWWAEEIVRQYKNGDFGEYKIEGRDNSNSPFMVKVKPKQIDDSWHFECELIPDLLRDKAANISWAIQAVKAGLLSVETARDESQLVVDTDLEGDKIARERARALFGLGELEAVLELAKDYARSPTPESRFILAHAYKKLGDVIKAEMGQGPQAPVPAPPNNVVAVPENIREAARNQMPTGVPPGMTPMAMGGENA